MISFRTEPGPRLLAGGLEVHSSTIIQQRRGLITIFSSHAGSAFFGTISLPVEEMASFGAAIAGCDLTPPDDALTSHPHKPRWQSSSGCMRRRAAGGGRSRNHRPSRGGAGSRAGTDRSHGRMPRHRRDQRGQVGAAATTR